MFLLYLPWKALFLLGGIITAETVPSCLFFSSSKYLIQPRNPLADAATGPPWPIIERLATPIRLHLPRSSGWNTSVTIGIDGQWFEVEREEQLTCRIRMPTFCSLAAGKSSRYTNMTRGRIEGQSTTKPETVGDVS